MPNKKKSIPLYLQIKENVKKEIACGNWSPGQRLMTEAELAEKFQVSRMTARHALQELENEGVVVRFRSLGTYLAPNKLHRNLDKLLSFGEIMENHGQKPVRETYCFEIIPADNTLSGILEIQEGDPIIRTEQLQFADEQPFAILKLYMVQALCPGITASDFERTDYYDVLKRKYGINIKYGDQTIEAIGATAEDAEKLQVAAGFPLLKICRVIYDTRSCPVSYSVSVNRSDKYMVYRRLKRY